MLLIRGEVIYLGISIVLRELLLNRHPCLQVFVICWRAAFIVTQNQQKMGPVNLTKFHLLPESLFCDVYWGTYVSSFPCRPCAGIYQAVVATARLIVILDLRKPGLAPHQVTVCL